jgi:hypothetical protein
MSTSCDHRFCGDCINGCLEAVLASSSFPACCPVCRLDHVQNGSGAAGPPNSSAQKSPELVEACEVLRGLDKKENVRDFESLRHSREAQRILAAVAMLLGYDRPAELRARQRVLSQPDLIPALLRYNPADASDDSVKWLQSCIDINPPSSGASSSMRKTSTLSFFDGLCMWVRAVASLASETPPKDGRSDGDAHATPPDDRAQVARRQAAPEG